MSDKEQEIPQKEIEEPAIIENQASNENHKDKDTSGKKQRKSVSPEAHYKFLKAENKHLKNSNKALRNQVSNLHSSLKKKSGINPED